jgi:hypothetical protein
MTIVEIGLERSLYFKIFNLFLHVCEIGSHRIESFIDHKMGISKLIVYIFGVSIYLFEFSLK